MKTLIARLLLAASLIVGCSSPPAAQGPRAVAAPMVATSVSRTLMTTLAVSAASVTSAAVAAPTVAQLIGQKLVVRMTGVTPTADLLGRIRRGEIGGVVLFASNVTTRTALVALTTKLQAAATAGGQPPLLIAVDQEGGPVKRIPWAPPTLSAPQMGRIGSSATANQQGAATGAALKGLGINVDFAPVADVPASTASFMYRAGRTFSFSSTRTARLADAFATGLKSAGVMPTMKHFPGIGFATRNTDSNVVTITASRTALAPGLRPYQTAIGHDIPMIMLSNATYTAYDRVYAAGWSHAIGVTLLRGGLGFKGVTITDALDGAASVRGLSSRSLAIRAARAGTDMILITGSEATSRSVYLSLLKNVENGTISRAALRASYDRILVLKAGL